jgi:hypothetical protein
VGLKIVANCSDVVPKRAKSLVWALWANSGYNEVDGLTTERLSDVVPKRAKSLVWAIWANSGYNEGDGLTTERLSH